jgi:sporulation-control protein spo0M
MAKAKAKKTEEVKKGLDIKLKLEKSDKGRLTVTVTLLENGKEIASDYDFVQVD